MAKRSSSSGSKTGATTYEVGYGKPPKHTRFKPGQSGNPKGRRRGRRNLRTVVEETLREKITIREGDRTRTVARQDAIVLVTANNALKGDTKAFAAFLQLVRLTGLMGEEPETSSQDSVSAGDDAILAEFLEREGTISQKEQERTPLASEAESPDRQPDANAAKPKGDK
jgi:hypothetical protein